MQDPEVNEILEELVELEEPKMNEPNDTDDEKRNSEEDMDDEVNDEISDNQGPRPVTINSIRVMANGPEPAATILPNTGSLETGREGVTDSVTPTMVINSIAPRMEAHSIRKGFRVSTETNGPGIPNNATA